MFEMFNKSLKFHFPVETRHLIVRKFYDIFYFLNIISDIFYFLGTFLTFSHWMTVCTWDKLVLTFFWISWCQFLTFVYSVYHFLLLEFWKMSEKNQNVRRKICQKVLRLSISVIAVTYFEIQSDLVTSNIQSIVIWFYTEGIPRSSKRTYWTNH